MNELNEESIKGVLNGLNPEVFEKIKLILSFNKITSVKISTFLLNFFLQENYFPWINKLRKVFPFIEPPKLETTSISEFFYGSERYFGLVIMICLKYRRRNTISMEDTIQRLDLLWKSTPLINRFFIFNSIDPKYQIIQLNPLLDALRESQLRDKLLPDLGFDPEFQKVLDNPAFYQLFDTSWIDNFFKGKVPEGQGYLPEKDWFFSNMNAKKNPKPIFLINSGIFSQFNKNWLNYSPFFSSKAQIDDIIETLKKYYILRIPSKSDEIQKNLTCFGELLKLSKASFYISFKKGALIKKLAKTCSKSDINNFLDRFCLGKKDMEFNFDYKNFNPYEFVKEYGEFILFAIFEYHGILATGVNLIWRSMIKYLEILQNEQEFKDIKGPLLENWCYEKAVEFGFDPIKLILKNTRKVPTERYYEMKEQIKDFPGKTLEFSIDFPEGYRPTFHEIDLIIFIEEYVFIFECKSTSAPLGEYGDFIKWLDNFDYNIQLLINKGNILVDNIVKETIIHPALQGVKKFVPNLIQTEGIYPKYLTLSTHSYIQFLAVLKEQIDLGTEKEYLKNNFGLPTQLTKGVP